MWINIRKKEKASETYFQNFEIDLFFRGLWVTSHFHTPCPSFELTSHPNWTILRNHEWKEQLEHCYIRSTTPDDGSIFPRRKHISS